MSDVQAETGMVLYRSKRFASIDIRVSNPASSSVLRFLNESEGELQLSVAMIEGVPKTAGPGPSAPSAVGNHLISGGGHFTVAFDVPYGGSSSAGNSWITRFALWSPDGSSKPRRFRLSLVNCPGRVYYGEGVPGNRPGDNFATVQFDTL